MVAALAQLAQLAQESGSEASWSCLITKIGASQLHSATASRRWSSSSRLENFCESLGEPMTSRVAD